MKGLKDQFADWVTSKPADETYDYCDDLGCAYCQFLIAQGMASQPSVGPTYWYDMALAEFIKHDLPDGVNDAVIGERTFGALAQRLNAS